MNEHALLKILMNLEQVATIYGVDHTRYCPLCSQPLDMEERLDDHECEHEQCWPVDGDTQ